MTSDEDKRKAAMVLGWAIDQALAAGVIVPAEGGMWVVADEVVNVHPSLSSPSPDPTPTSPTPVGIPPSEGYTSSSLPSSLSVSEVASAMLARWHQGKQALIPFATRENDQKAWDATYTLVVAEWSALQGEWTSLVTPEPSLRRFLQWKADKGETPSPRGYLGWWRKEAKQAAEGVEQAIAEGERELRSNPYPSSHPAHSLYE